MLTKFGVWGGLPDMFLKFEFQDDRSMNAGAVGVEKAHCLYNSLLLPHKPWLVGWKWRRDLSYRKPCGFLNCVLIEFVTHGWYIDEILWSVELLGNSWTGRLIDLTLLASDGGSLSAQSWISNVEHLKIALCLQGQWSLAKSLMGNVYVFQWSEVLQCTFLQNDVFVSNVEHCLKSRNSSSGSLSISAWW